ncbi:hypothetical protein FISHEDRAFT_68487 [Fistulina hepatica ATCC 64428]|uniref:Arrestin-like N-terminal domain-containing protein n=1 Tax=Fistulina hepatica ATCC 64428 TaxID=1128425 RepID=A0A0D7ARG1_9AGAR|nr:hypothetical protein FISHEDRAFT_68487 [Fistulina hepatica ATCC 64428]
MYLSSDDAIFDPFMLPPYSPAGPAPLYTWEPSELERRLQYTPGNRHPRHTSTFMRKCGPVAMLLYNRDSGESTPTYGRRDVVEGAVNIDCSARCRIQRVVVQLDARADAVSTGTLAVNHVLFRESATLWSAEGRAASCCCPSLLPFALRFPTTFRDPTRNNQNVVLPPSFDTTFHSMERSLFACVQYTITVLVSKGYTLGVFPNTKKIFVPFNFQPRSRAYQSLPPRRGAFFLDSLKSVPEEWVQFTLTVPAIERPPRASIDVHFFIPTVKIFALRDRIPFHITLRGPGVSLRDFLVRERSGVRAVTPPPVRVHIMRQVAVEASGRRAQRSTVISRLEDWCVSPLALTAADVRDDDGELDFSGELLLRCDVSVGGFAAAGIIVQDYMVFTVASPSRPLQHVVPIRIVTDSWIDEVSFYEEWL